MKSQEIQVIKVAKTLHGTKEVDEKGRSPGDKNMSVFRLHKWEY